MSAGPEQMAGAALTWLQKHERIVIVFMVLAVGGWIGNKYLNLRSDFAKHEATVATQRFDLQEQHNEVLASQVKQLSGQYQALQAQLAQENANFASAIKSRVVVLRDDQRADRTMPMPDLGRRWAQLANIPPADLTPTSNGITVTVEGSRSTVEQLERVPVLQKNLKDESDIASNEGLELSKSQALIGSLDTEVSGLNKAIDDGNVACKAQIASVKATANKSKLKWFKIGFVTGFVAGVFTGHSL